MSLTGVDHEIIANRVTQIDDRPDSDVVDRGRSDPTREHNGALLPARQDCIRGSHRVGSQRPQDDDLGTIPRRGLIRIFGRSPLGFRGRGGLEENRCKNEHARKTKT